MRQSTTVPNTSKINAPTSFKGPCALACAWVLAWVEDMISVLVGDLMLAEAAVVIVADGVCVVVVSVEVSLLY